MPTKSLDEIKLITTLLCDVHSSHGDVFNSRALRLTTQKVEKRCVYEGISFLTKTMPRLGKCLDKALARVHDMTAVKHGFKTMPNSELPIFLGEFFIRIFDKSGAVLHDPCADSIIILRQILYCFYKYELNYDDKQKQAVISKFIETEKELETISGDLLGLAQRLPGTHTRRRRFHQMELPVGAFAGGITTNDKLSIVREARIALNKLFSCFDPSDIIPKHGPGVVSTRERLESKWTFTNVPDRITDVYPLDAFFMASLGHVCDSWKDFKSISNKENSARVILVPKDSRGPRLISCEPLENQWVQQGLGRAIVRLVERHELTKFNVFFTDQGPNQRGALLGSFNGLYSTLDLNEASDRVTLELVRLLFPSNIFTYLEACRSLSTELPDGNRLHLRKYAPMGSALCFPVLALTIWSLLYAGSPDAGTREGTLVYGDDVIVPTAYAANAMNILESFGLKINRDKSCTSGSFRESCGTDAFQGINVTPVRFRTVWSSSRSPDVYSSWIAYANSMYDRRYFKTYDYIRENLFHVYGLLQGNSLGEALSLSRGRLPHGSGTFVRDNCDCRDQKSRRSCYLREVPQEQRLNRQRTNHDYQRREELFVEVKSRPMRRGRNSGWSNLFRFLIETSDRPCYDDHPGLIPLEEALKRLVPWQPFTVSAYTEQHASMLAWSWR